MVNGIGKFYLLSCWFSMTETLIRWAKISQAMGGSRTPRQVASRVQKYFEKLKLVGVGVEKKSRASFKS
jgi:hypothetical protein